MMIDLTLSDPRWSDLDLQNLADRAAAATLTALTIDEAEISLLACDDAEISQLNAEFREKPTPTNVLSWPAEDLAPEIAGAPPAQPSPDFTGELALGDIAIAWETCAREAKEAGISMPDHVTHLVIHGILHLLGYDHIRDADATLMEGLEVAILGKLGIDDPYNRSHDD
jgi:probable rRNA maturation factor